jgi:hypothetical protein
MATLQTNIPMMGQQPDFGNALARGYQAGAFANQQMRQNALAKYQQANASGIMSGDPEAIAGLAEHDMDAAMRARVGNLQAREAEAQLDAREAAIAAQEMESIMRPLAVAYANGDQASFEAMVAQAGLEGVTMDNFEMVAAKTAETYEMLMNITDANAGEFKVVDGQLVHTKGDKASVVDLGQDAQQGFRVATPEEAAQYGAQAGQIDTKTGRFYPTGGKGQTINVNTGDSAPQVGTIPQGYELHQDPETGGYRMQPIPGGPEDTSSEQAAARENKLTQAEIVLEDIDWVLDTQQSSRVPVTGIIGANAQRVPGTVAHDVARTLDTIRANVGFDKLQAMREASPTGGALGQVSEQENRLLQSVLGNLEQSQTEERFRANLERLKTVYLDIIHGEGNWTLSQDGSVSIRGQSGDISDEDLLRLYGVD